jgi:pyruvate/2-oxoglutarate dehydrogenase complex dihydrolipoamide acyltransferase (E2) component
MRYTVKLPVLGDTTRYGVIDKWLVAVGESVEVDQPLVAVESDKAIVEVPSPFAGILVEQLVTIEDEVEIGAPIAIVDGSA